MPFGNRQFLFLRGVAGNSDLMADLLFQNGTHIVAKFASKSDLRKTFDKIFCIISFLSQDCGPRMNNSDGIF
jgi:hypothetical protein